MVLSERLRQTDTIHGQLHCQQPQCRLGDVRLDENRLVLFLIPYKGTTSPSYIVDMAGGPVIFLLPLDYS
jgi:hypothetical protein